jgi:hypothetical protein
VYGSHNSKNSKTYRVFYDGRKQTTLALLGRCLMFIKYEHLQMLAYSEGKKIKLNSRSEFPLTLAKQEELIKITFKEKSVLIPELTFQATVLAWFDIIKDKPVIVELAPGELCFTYTLISSTGKTINSCKYCCGA